MTLEPPNNDDTPTQADVKSKLIPGTRQKQEFKIRLQGMLLYAFQDYCNKRSLSMEQAMRELLESKLVEQRYLPEWWWERSGTHH